MGKIYGDTVGGGGSKLKSVPQSDWAQTDNTQPDYIKNKPESGQIFDVANENGVLTLKASGAICEKATSYDVAVQQGFEGTHEEWTNSVIATRSASESATAATEAATNASANATKAETAAGQAMGFATEAKAAALSMGDFYANALKNSESGEAVGLTDVSPIEHEMTVKVSSKNLIPVPYKTTDGEYIVGQSYVRNGVTFIINADGSITLDGTASANIFFSLVTPRMKLADGAYTLSGGYRGADGTTKIAVCVRDEADNIMASCIDQSATFTTAIKGNLVKEAYLYVYKDAVLDNVTVYPQLEEGTTATSHTSPIGDFSAVKVKKYGKNLIDIKNPTYKLNAIYEVDSEGVATLTRGDLATGTSGTYVSRAYWKFGNYDDFVGKTFVVSLDVTEKSVAKSDIVYIIADFNTRTANNIKVTSFLTTGKCTLYFTVPENTGGWKTLGLHIYCESLGTNDSTGEYIKFKDLQLEAGTTATECEEYKEPTEYPVNEDGTVKGVTSLSPTTTLMTDTAGAVIDCTYSRDINKVYEQLTQAIVSLGGNV